MGAQGLALTQQTKGCVRTSLASTYDARIAHCESNCSLSSGRRRRRALCIDNLVQGTGYRCSGRPTLLKGWAVLWAAATNAASCGQQQCCRAQSPISSPRNTRLPAHHAPNIHDASYKCKQVATMFRGNALSLAKMEERGRPHHPRHPCVASSCFRRT